MTAEIFSASFLGCLLAFAAMSVFTWTVYVPLRGWLGRRRALRRLQGESDLVSVGADYVPCPLESPEERANSLRQFEAQSELCLVALDVTDDFRDQRPTVDRILAAAQAFRRATTPRARKQMRAMKAFRKVQQEPDGPT